MQTSRLQIYQILTNHVQMLILCPPYFINTYSKNFFSDSSNIYLKTNCWRHVSCMYLLLKLRQIFNELCEWRGSGISIPWIHKYTLIFRRSKPFTDDPELFLQKGIELFYIYLTLFLIISWDLLSFFGSLMQCRTHKQWKFSKLWSILHFFQPIPMK